MLFNQQSSEEGYEQSEKLDSSGSLVGQLVIPDDFDRMGEDEIAALFEG